MKTDGYTEAFADLRLNGTAIHEEDWTETDTRSKFIDKFLIECLGWKEEDIRRELSSDGKRLDYVLSLMRPSVVVEAKRASIKFPVVNERKIRKINIGKYLKANPTMLEHLTQVRSYCVEWSVPLAVLTNGETYFCFVALRTDGVNWKEGDLIVTPNIFNSQIDFSEVFSLLSRESFLNENLIGQLCNREMPNPRSVISSYSNPKALLSRNPLGLALEPLLQHVFSDVTDDSLTDIIENCYVLPGETTLRNEEFESLLLDRPPAYSPGAISIASTNAFVTFQESIKDYLTRQQWSQTLLVIGGVGVGKTMFLRRFFFLKPEAHAVQNKTCPFYIDFRKPGLDPREIPALIYGRL